ncbi:MAG: hypothetical protein QOC92_2825 [Acidimicrobiaceae bacterium]|jgi:hypothetical protein
MPTAIYFNPEGVIGRTTVYGHLVPKRDTTAEVAMRVSSFTGSSGRTPRRASSIHAWAAPPRNLDWIAARFGLA